MNVRCMQTVDHAMYEHRTTVVIQQWCHWKVRAWDSSSQTWPSSLALSWHLFNRLCSKMLTCVVTNLVVLQNTVLMPICLLQNKALVFFKAVKRHTPAYGNNVWIISSLHRFISSVAKSTSANNLLRMLTLPGSHAFSGSCEQNERGPLR